MAVRAGFEAINYTPTSIEQLLAPIKMQADTDALYARQLSAIKDSGDYLSPAVEDTKMEYENSIGKQQRQLIDNLKSSKHVDDSAIDSLIDLKNKNKAFFSSGGIGYQRALEKEKLSRITKKSS